MQSIAIPTRTFTASAALGPYLRVKLDSNTELEAAGALDLELGTLQNRVVAENESVGVLLNNAEGTRIYVASAAITALARVYGAAGGKISMTPNANPIGIALEAASGDGSQIEVYRTSFELITTTFVYNAPSDTDFFVASRDLKVVAISHRPQVVGSDGGAVTAVIKKAPSATATASGTALHTGSLDLKATANTTVAATLSATAGDTELSAGDAIGIDVTGTTTAARGTVTIAMIPR